MITALLVAALTVAAPAPWTDTGPLTLIKSESGVIDPAVHGVWRSRGYGWLLNINESGVTRFQEGDVCYITPESTSSLSEMASVSYRYFRMLPDENSAIFQLLDGDTNVIFDRLDTLPKACSEPLDLRPSAVANAFLDHFERHYAFFDRRSPDFGTRRDRFKADFDPDGGDEALWTALSAFMDGLSDSHTKLIGQVKGEKLHVQDGQGKTLPVVRDTVGEKEWLVGLIEQTMAGLGGTGRHVLRDRLIWGLIDGRVGYLQIFVMGGFTDRQDFASPAWAAAERAALDAALDEAFAAFFGLEAVIVDLSNNRGGWDAIAKMLPGRFTDVPYVGFTTQAHGSGLAPFPHLIEPARGPRYKGPVYLLTSDVTVSGGELSTLAFLQLPQVVHAGETTRGAFSTPLAKPLPNGWLLELSNETFAAPDGKIYEESGLTPDLPVEVYPTDDPIGGHWRAIRYLVRAAMETTQ